MTKNKIELESGCCTVEPQQAPSWLQQDRQSEEQAAQRQEQSAEAVETVANLDASAAMCRTLLGCVNPLCQQDRTR
jgi:hypothetical protein